MKTKLTSLLIIIAFVFSFVDAKAKTNEALNVSVKSSGIVILRYTAAAKTTPKVTILDSENKVVYSEKISGKNAAARVYNITALPEGEYFFEVVENGVKTVKSITYKKEVVAKASNLKINVANAEAAGKYQLICKKGDQGLVNVAIYSKTEGLIFEDVVEAKGNFKRTYDLSKLSAGEYVFEVSSNEEAVSKSVSLARN